MGEHQQGVECVDTKPVSSCLSVASSASSAFMASPSNFEAISSDVSDAVFYGFLAGIVGARDPRVRTCAAAAVWQIGQRVQSLWVDQNPLWSDFVRVSRKMQNPRLIDYLHLFAIVWQ